MKQKAWHLISIIIGACLLMAVVDLWLASDYWMKALIKSVIFVFVPIMLNFKYHFISIRTFFIFKKPIRLHTFLFPVGIYVIIILAFLSLGELVDLTNVTPTLEQTIGVNATNFIYIAVYISVINALIEELFFRGFAFLGLRNLVKRKWAYLFSAGIFSIYHVSMMVNWFSPTLFILILFGLMLAGLMFNRLNEQSNSIYPSWLVHASANLAINTIGLILFNMI